MEKRIKKIAFAISILILFFISPKNIYALMNDISYTSVNTNYMGNYDYVIDKYDVNIIVNENNTFDITETILVYFNIPKHGISRTIPLNNTVTRLDGTVSRNRARITNVSVNSEYVVSRGFNDYKLKIGSANKTITGEQKYVIKYTYSLGRDPMKDYDELYYNIIGDDIDTIINNVSFSIIMPKEFDSNKLGFSSGIVGSTDSSRINYSVDGNKISGVYNGILGAREALTVRCELPEGYFIDVGHSTIDYIIFLIPVIFLGITILLWFKYNKNDKVIETVEFYPPDELNSLDVGFLYKGKTENKDVTSLLIFLANKGYLEIIDNSIDLNSKKINLSQNSKENVNKKIIELQNKIVIERKNNPNSKKIKYYENMLDIYKDFDTSIDYKGYVDKYSINKLNKDEKFLIRKLKDYDGTDINEQWFMEGLFECGRTDVTDKMLYNNFYVTNNKILNNVNKCNINKVFEKSNKKVKIFIVLMLIVTFLLITILPMITYGQPELLLGAIVFPGIGFSLLFGVLFSKLDFVSKLFAVLFGLGFGGLPWLFITFPIIIQDSFYLTGYVIGVICMLIMGIIFKCPSKRTKYGNEMLGKIRGFKNFLETVEKEKLESLVMQNPNYFYDILPYTYVLGISDKWIKKFETISLCAPSWYDSTNSFDVDSFESFMNSTMSTACNAMASVPYTSSGSSSDGSSSSSSSGGGSSGGGSGGGGVSSW